MSDRCVMADHEQSFSVTEKRLRGGVSQVSVHTGRSAYSHFHFALTFIVTLLDRLSCVVAAAAMKIFSLGVVPSEFGGVVTAASLVSVLVFMIAPTHRELLQFPQIRLAGSQIRYLAGPVLLSALSGGLVLAVSGLSFRSVLLLIACWLAVAVLLLLTERTGVVLALRRPSVVSRLRRRIAVVGSGEEAAGIAERIRGEASQSCELYGIFSEH